MSDKISLRPFLDADEPFLRRLTVDPDALGPFEWAGFTDARGRQRRWETDGYVGTHSTALAVVGPDDVVIGIVSWEARTRGGPIGGCYEIGCALLPEHRGNGWGTLAQRMLITYLFQFTLANRLEAQTDADNIAEQRALERIGFRREGVLRQVRFRHGVWQDMLIYGLLRAEIPDPLQ
ncbi:GNAT family N-acetyltransferase [Amorphoplanes digitatis]|uniref:RimJ/RimL family protein N-acetyltransferase n=1 Tax=Actinoplanes digitatis TaxID=1868 RepID=A0A7W7MSL1_9ACTN|nr:GNAT family protein [Actinoplanes digitatis]MBB4764780.1 RimJ/RimL family protein N-acetyltransferase [Actinoplanes digitatis]BFE74353.1 GNAT family protein [Actinoplanes digitatis]GID91267.1 N-acetyltransferase [Actinoplanes digitatis]